VHILHNGRLNVHSRKLLWTNDLGPENERNAAGEKFAAMQHKRFGERGRQDGKGTTRRQAAWVVFQTLTLTISQGERGLKLHNLHNRWLKVHSHKSLWENDLGAENERNPAGKKFVAMQHKQFQSSG